MRKRGKEKVKTSSNSKPGVKEKSTFGGGKRKTNKKRGKVMDSVGVRPSGMKEVSKVGRSQKKKTPKKKQTKRKRE